MRTQKMSSSTGLRPRFLLENVDGVTVARFSEIEIIDEGVIGEIDEQLRVLAEGWDMTAVLLNFQEVQHLSSTMLAVLLSFSRRVARRQGRLKLCGLSPDLLEIFRITRFDRLFEIHDEERFALDSFLVTSHAHD